jgi:membrane associated rhomboid family serine protease
MSSADYREAALLYQRIIGFDDPAITAAAMLGFAQALHRLDDEPSAMAYWLEVTRLPETPATYAAWREIASARVRSGDNAGALAAYREAQRRAPAADKPEIASRLGWLSKELGDQRGAAKYFGKARGPSGAPVGGITPILIGITVVISVIASAGIGASDTSGGLIDVLALDKAAIAAGELWRLFTVVLVHAPFTSPLAPLHLLLNMYLLWIVGPIAERLYGRVGFVAAYLVLGLGGSLATFAFSQDQFGVGASGAIFGLIGMLVGAHYIHRPLLDGATRAVMGQLVPLIAINLVFGLSVSGIDNWAHIGGLVTGLWLGALLPPTGVPTMRSLWRRAGPQPGTTVPAFGVAGTRTLQLVGIGALMAAFGVLWTLGDAFWGPLIR